MRNHHIFHAMRRHRHGHHPFGDWGRGFGGGGDGGFPGGRKLSSADLQLVLLALLEKQPAHGYELIRALEERSGGFYAPSPGVIYPALTYLDEIGRAVAEAEGNRKLYRLTEDGRAFLDANRAQAETILEALERIGKRMDDVRAAFAGDDESGAPGDLHAARHELKHALMRKRGCAPEEARRIADILRRAASDILGH